MTKTNLDNLVSTAIHDINDRNYEKIIFVDSYVNDENGEDVVSLFAYEDEGTWGENFGDVDGYGRDDVIAAMRERMYEIETDPTCPTGWMPYGENDEAFTAKFVYSV